MMRAKPPPHYATPFFVSVPVPPKTTTAVSCHVWPRRKRGGQSIHPSLIVGTMCALSIPMHMHVMYSLPIFRISSTKTNPTRFNPYVSPTFPLSPRPRQERLSTNDAILKK
jgi:hypothetical protein